MVRQDRTVTYRRSRPVDGRYLLTLDRVFTDASASPAEWLVVVGARSVPADTATVQKIINDIYVQTL
jgi:hypothetical protein